MGRRPLRKMSSPDASLPDQRLSGEARRVLHETALAAIEYGLDHGRAPRLDLSLYSEDLRVESATFVTLHRANRLRGCMGTLQVNLPLIQDISQNAWRSANSDPRFSPVKREEFSDLNIHLSVLSPLSPVPVNSHAELLRKLRPGIDGLVLREHGARATFLPSVWEQLPTPERFVAELLHKAKLGKNHWSDSIELERYTVEEF